MKMFIYGKMTNFDEFIQPFYSDKPQKHNFKQKVK